MNTYEFSVLCKKVDNASTQTKLSVLTKMVTTETKTQTTNDSTTTPGYL